MNRVSFHLPTWATIRPLTLSAGLFVKIVVAAALCWLPYVARAGSLTVGFDIEFSGGQAPASATKPWIQMSITDNGPNSVLFLLTAPHLTGSENIDLFDFNLDPALANILGQVSFTNLIKTGSFDTPTISQVANGFKADGDGFYDFELQFTTGGNVGKTFTTGDSLQYTLTGAGISASSFDFLSAPGGGHGPFITAAHIQNTTGAGNGGSGWIADTTGGIFTNQTPEPSTFVLAAVGCFGGVWFVRRRSRTAGQR
jgi:hypothetical protein